MVTATYVTTRLGKRLLLFYRPLTFWLNLIWLISFIVDDLVTSGKLVGLDHWMSSSDVLTFLSRFKFFFFFFFLLLNFLIENFRTLTSLKLCFPKNVFCNFFQVIIYLILSLSSEYHSILSEYTCDLTFCTQK